MPNDFEKVPPEVGDFISGLGIRVQPIKPGSTVAQALLNAPPAPTRLSRKEMLCALTAEGWDPPLIKRAGTKWPFYNLTAHGQAYVTWRVLQLETGRPTHEARLVVNIKTLTATLDSVEYELANEDVARFLNVLAERPQQWISGKEFDRYDKLLIGRRMDKLKAKLPDKLDVLIESRTNKGYRLTFDRHS